jgi:hypothetical protein
MNKIYKYTFKKLYIEFNIFNHIKYKYRTIYYIPAINVYSHNVEEGLFISFDFLYFGIMLSIFKKNFNKYKLYKCGK